MGFHTRDIKENCAKCKEYHIKKLVPGCDFPVDWCKMSNDECGNLEKCDKKAMAWVRK